MILAMGRRGAPHGKNQKIFSHNFGFEFCTTNSIQIETEVKAWPCNF